MTPPADAPKFAVVPFKPHRMLFAAIGLLMVLWIAALIFMYMTTVPHGQVVSPTTAQSAAP